MDPLPGPDRLPAARDPAHKGFSATDPRIAAYVERLLEPEDAVLREIRARCAREGLPPIAIGPFEGRHLEVLARVAGARRIVEIGTLGGYSGVCLARALPPGGRLDTFELSERHARVAEESFRCAGVGDRVRIHLGPALERLPAIEAEGPFDLVFVDADKRGYPDYLAWAGRHLRPGGTVIADNVFRRAAIPVDGDDPRNAEGIRRFNETLANSSEWRATLLPLEDGFAVAVRT
jgi:caffeoyl-CoA O-methyltransferase